MIEFQSTYCIIKTLSHTELFLKQEGPVFLQLSFVALLSYTAVSVIQKITQMMYKK
jgi:hypothetical protein